ncbi:MAG TPA: hypothetical protein VFX15_00185 [Actinomycetes bacterium]|nr:hypothetical protein [Actinomycetes bacterium]
MSSKVTIGTCIWCLKTKAVKLNTQTLVKGRREGVCLECASMTKEGRERLRRETLDGRKRRTSAEKFRQEYPR